MCFWTNPEIEPTGFRPGEPILYFNKFHHNLGSEFRISGRLTKSSTFLYINKIQTFLIESDGRRFEISKIFDFLFFDSNQTIKDLWLKQKSGRNQQFLIKSKSQPKSKIFDLSKKRPQSKIFD